MKTQKGITLIALIITIIVLLILAVVTIGAVKEGGVITHAQNATSSYKKAQIEEEVNLYAMEYYMNNKRNLKEDTIEEIIEICEATGVTPNQLTVHYDLHNANANKEDENSNLQEEYVLYRIDKTTEAERETLEAKDVNALRGDFDMDGVLTKKDVEGMINFNFYGEIDGEDPLDENEEIKEKFVMIFKVADIDDDDDEWIDMSDVYIVNGIVNGTTIYTGGYVQ